MSITVWLVFFSLMRFMEGFKVCGGHKSLLFIIILARARALTSWAESKMPEALPEIFPRLRDQIPHGTPSSLPSSSRSIILFLQSLTYRLLCQCQGSSGQTDIKILLQLGDRRNSTYQTGTLLLLFPIRPTHNKHHKTTTKQWAHLFSPRPPSVITAAATLPAGT